LTLKSLLKPVDPLTMRAKLKPGRPINR